MKNAVKSLAIILALAASSAFAQQMAPPSGDPAAHMQHHFAMLTKHLDLTAAQQQQATTIFNNMVATQTNIHNSLKTAHDGLNSAIKSNDTAAIDQAATTIGNLTAQMISNHAKAKAAFFQILTPDQQAKMTQMESEHGNFDGPEGPHGHHGPPGAHSGKPQSE
jgi:Spy/CpxP family protein refolding chaperone